jgi:hypothetical protein
MKSAETGTQSFRGRRMPAGRGLIAATVVAVASLVVASVAFPETDELKGGSVAMQLQNSKGLKLNPKSLTVPVVSGQIDPVTGAGTANVSGAFKAKRGKSKAKVTLLSLTLGANGGPGSIAAKVGKNKVGNFGSLSGGTVARSGFGTTISNVTAKITSKGLKALSGKGGKGKKSAASAKTAPLGTITSLTTVPLAVHVVPGQGNLLLHTAAMGAFVNKLPSHCIDPIAGSPPGVAPIAPATTSGLGGTDYTFPVTDGSIGPDFGAGELFTAGGQLITKNSTPILTPGACTSSAPPTGTQLISVKPSVNFNTNTIDTIATLPGGNTLPRAQLGDINWSTGTRSINPTTGAVTITGATLTLASLSVPVLNSTFPNVGAAGNEFATGDLIGTIDVTGVKLR